MNKGIGGVVRQKFNDISPDDRPDIMTETEYATAFATLERDWLSGRKQSLPRSVFYVTGVPGAGKSTLTRGILRAHAERGEHEPLVIDFDELRAFHPRYRQHVAADSINAAAKVNKSVERMIDWVFEESAKRGIDVIIDGSGMGRDITRGIFVPYLREGYTVETLVLAVPVSIAQQSVRLRYEETFALAEKGGKVLPRWVESRQQAKAPENLQETVETLVQEGICTDFRVVTRDRTLLFKDSDIKDTSGLVAIISDETYRPLTQAERERMDKNDAKIAEMTRAREIIIAERMAVTTPAAASKAATYVSNIGVAAQV